MPVAQQEIAVADARRAQHFMHAVQEGLPITLRVETNNIITAHCTQQFRRTRQGLHDRRWHERRVEEKANPVLDPKCAQIRGERK